MQSVYDDVSAFQVINDLPCYSLLVIAEFNSIHEWFMYSLCSDINHMIIMFSDIKVKGHCMTFAPCKCPLYKAYTWDKIFRMGQFSLDSEMWSPLQLEQKKGYHIWPGMLFLVAIQDILNPSPMKQFKKNSTEKYFILPLVNKLLFMARDCYF